MCLPKTIMHFFNHAAYGFICEKYKYGKVTATVFLNFRHIYAAKKIKNHVSKKPSKKMLGNIQERFSAGSSKTF